MSKSITIIFVILIIFIAGFAYINYNRLNQIQDDLIKKETFLKESEKLIQEQEKSLIQLEEKIKEVLEKEETSPSLESIVMVRESEFQEQLKKNQEELQALQTKIEEFLEKSKSDAEIILLLKEEKSKLEMLLAEREEQWQENVEESRRVITSLQKEIEQYESKIEGVSNQLINIEKHFAEEASKRKELEENIMKYEERINDLQGQLALKRDDEIYVQQISQLQMSKKQLEAEIAEKNSYLQHFQQEYQSLQEQLGDHKQKVDKLQQEMVQALGQKEMLTILKDNLAQLEQEKSKLEKMLQEKETQWLEKDQIHKDTITLLQEEIAKYESNIKEIGNEVLVLKEDLIKERSLKWTIEKEIEAFASEIEKLKEEVSLYKDIEKTYQDTLQKLQLDKEILEKELLQKGELIDQQEYQELANQLAKYQEHIEELKKELVKAKEIEEEARKAQLAEIQREKEALLNMLTEKEGEWTKQNEENRRLISSLKEQVKEYQQEVELIKLDSSIFKEEIATQIELYQQTLAQISEREDQISLLTAQIEQYIKKVEDYERDLIEIKTKLQQLGEVNFEEQQNLMETIRSLIKERDEYQYNINQFSLQVDRLQLEIAELQNKIGLLEKGTEPKYYEVRSGDCLWTIAKNKYNEGIAWIKIFKANQDQIENPDLIFPYQRFILPD